MMEHITMISDKKSEGVPVSLLYTKCTRVYFGFYATDTEERWLEKTSIVGNMDGVTYDGHIAHLRIKEHIFKQRRELFQKFVSSTT